MVKLHRGVKSFWTTEKHEDAANARNLLTVIISEPDEPINPCLPKGGGVANPFGFSLFNALYPYYYFQCIAIIVLLFPLITKQVPTIVTSLHFISKKACPQKFGNILNMHKQ